jgi:hypothetical protein
LPSSNADCHLRCPRTDQATEEHHASILGVRNLFYGALRRVS